MASVNKFLGIGRLGHDPELKFLPTGSACCNFSIAMSDSWIDKQGQKQEKTEWVGIVVYGKIAEICNQYLKKGSQCYIEGKLQTRSWDDKDGKKCYRTEVNAQTVQFLDSKKDASQETEIKTDSNFTSDNIPF